MAGRKLMVARKISGSTVLEVVISMVIILLVFGIAMTIYGNVAHSSLSVSKLSAEALLRERLLYIQQDPSAENASVTEGAFLVEQEIKLYDNNTHLKQVHLVARDLNKVKVAELYQVILVP